MSEWKKYFKKQGGIKLFKQYFRAGVLGTAVVQFLLLGRSKKALEILRLSVQLKTQERLSKRYLKAIKQEIKCFDNSLPQIYRKTIWIYWHQGIENAPLVVKRCFASVKENFADWEIVVITEANMQKYVQYPEYIIKKVRENKITLTHLSDILRLELLTRYGGLWLDATVFCTSRDIPRCILESDFFLYQSLKPGSNGRVLALSSWMMFSKSNNKVLTIAKNIIYEYWKKNDTMIDYFLLHHFINIILNAMPEEQIKIPRYSNSTPHILQLMLFEPFNAIIWEDLKRQCIFHKLSYKINDCQTSLKGTYYDYIINKNKIS